MDTPGPGTAEPTPEATDVVPATAAADEPGQSWFDDRLRDFVQALAVNHVGRPRSTQARHALAAAAHELIDRVAHQEPAGQAPEAWPREAVLQPHQLLANTFHVRSLLASGGVGQIYRARHRDLNTEHAVKILLPRHMLEPTLIAMLMTEARLLASIRHAGVVGCLGLLRDGDGRHLVVMDHLRGSTLSARLREGALSPADALGLARRLLNVLAAVHAAGVVHNDIAPDNIILRNDDINDPVLIDFGLARPLDAADAPETDQVTVDFAGKLSWAAPERLDGSSQRTDPRSDLYSLGLVLAAACLGHHLPMGTDRASAIAARRTPPVLDAIPDPLRSMVAALLQPSPSDRPPRADAALALLDTRPKSAAIGTLTRLFERKL